MNTRNRNKIIEAMARAAWVESGEPKPWSKLPKEVREEWISYQRAAVEKLEELVPEIRQLIGE